MFCSFIYFDFLLHPNRFHGEQINSCPFHPTCSVNLPPLYFPRQRIFLTAINNICAGAQIQVVVAAQHNRLRCNLTNSNGTEHLRAVWCEGFIFI